METRHRIHPVILAHARELRHPQTPAEATFWQALRNRHNGFKFRRQHPTERFIIDFYCAEAKLLIEIDGQSHLQPDRAEYDRVRTQYLEGLGYQLIRFTINDGRHNTDAVINKILEAAKIRIAERNVKEHKFPSPPPSSKGERGKE